MKFARLAVTAAAALAALSTATGCAFFKTSKPVANGAGANPRNRSSSRRCSR
jgi:hypothetical protein